MSKTIASILSQYVPKDLVNLSLKYIMISEDEVRYDRSLMHRQVCESRSSYEDDDSWRVWSTTLTVNKNWSLMMVDEYLKSIGHDEDAVYTELEQLTIDYNVSLIKVQWDPTDYDRWCLSRRHAKLELLLAD